METFDGPAADGNAYLVIEAVSGSPLDATVTGTPTSFFGLFEEGTFEVVNLGFSGGPVSRTSTALSGRTPTIGTVLEADSNNDNNDTALVRASMDGSGNALSETAVVRADFSLTPVSVKLGPLQLTVTVDVEDAGEFKFLGASFGRTGVDMKAQLVLDLSVTARLDAQLSAGGGCFRSDAKAARPHPSLWHSQR